MEFDLVIFDCDGVLVDSELLSVGADQECLAECGIELSCDEILERYTGISFAGMVADLEERHGPLPADFGDRHRNRLWPLFEKELRAIPGIADVLDSLDCRICVASSGRPDRLKHALSLVGLYDRFHPHIFSATEVPRGKPAPDLFLHAARRMGVAPDRSVVIEDSVPGVIAGVAAGMTVIGFVGASHCRSGDAARLSAQGAVGVVDDMAQLLPALAR
ncbi:MAG: HAD family hydrolase [Alphaproteobacteria bacterium]|nr:MAG: HAD family hydrolase [Alphaproteobacteria bacterium]